MRLLLTLLIGAAVVSCHKPKYDNTDCDTGCFKLSGKVMSMPNHVPISGAIVSLRQANTNLVECITDEAGYYTLTLPEGYNQSSNLSPELVFEKEGFLKKETLMPSFFEASNIGEPMVKDFMLYKRAWLYVNIKTTNLYGFTYLNTDVKYNQTDFGHALKGDVLYDTTLVYEVGGDVETDFSWFTTGGQNVDQPVETLIIPAGASKTVYIQL